MRDVDIVEVNGALSVTLNVRCELCGRPFGFRGVPCGASDLIPTRSEDGERVTLPLLSPEELFGMGSGTADDPPMVTGPGFTEPLPIGAVNEERNEDG